MGQSDGQIGFYNSTGWADLWRDPFKMLFAIDLPETHNWYKLYVIGYNIALDRDDRKTLEAEGHVEIDGSGCRKYGFSCYGGDDLMGLGTYRHFKEIMKGEE